MNTQQDLDFNEKLLAKLIDHFGTTRHSKDGGYILPDGRLLDLKRSDLEKRTLHNIVAEMMPKDRHGAITELTIINLMTLTGMIRYEPKGRVHIATEPTQEQRRRLFDIMKYSLHDYRVLISEPNGATIGDKMFQSPQAHELLEFFNYCFHSKQRTYREDEFSLTKDREDYVLVFRPEHRQVGRYQASTHTFSIQPEFERALEMFKKRVTSLTDTK